MNNTLFAAFVGGAAGLLVAPKKARGWGFVGGLALGTSVGILLRKDGALQPAEPPVRPRPTPGTRTPLPPPGERPECPAEGARVLLVGDSHAEGLWLHMQDAAKSCGIPFTKDFERGSGVSKWAGKRIAENLAAHNPTHVVISLAGNDMGRNAASVAAGVDQLLAQIKEAGATPMWINPPPFPFPDPNDIRGVWRARATEWFDSEPLTHLEKAPDGIHLTPWGYRTWTKDYIWPWVSIVTHKATV